ncbi:hypothetical protein LINGRAHAP2_LOCUS5814 [Linum grandiflorum]
MSKMHRIMLRFRPIAPKPAAGSSSSSGGGGSSPDLTSCHVTSKPAASARRRGKKRTKQVAGGGGHYKRSSKIVTTTLPLLPESPDGCGCQNIGDPTAGEYSSGTRLEGSMDETYGVGSTDEEKRSRLAMDSCPGFISDVVGKVTWTNESYRKMVCHGVDDEEMAVLLMTKWKAPVTRATVGCQVAAFSCRARVQYHNQGRGGGSVTVPCDVWGMEGGGFAWRLDLNAALSLGR